MFLNIFSPASLHTVICTSKQDTVVIIVYSASPSADFNSRTNLEETHTKIPLQYNSISLMHSHLKKILTISLSQWSSEEIQGFLHLIEYTRFQFKGRKFTKRWLVNHMVSRVRMSWHIPQCSQLKASSKKWHMLMQNNLLMQQKWHTYLSSKEKRTQNNPTPLPNNQK